MEVLLFVSWLIQLLLRIYVYILWARFILEWVRILKRNFQPRGVFLVVVELIYTVTDPPIRLFRRILPPIRFGQISIDLGWILTLISCWILIAILP